MRKLDRYLIREMVGPFFFGMGAFAIVLVGVDVLYQALRMIMEQGLPAGPVLLSSLYRLPQTIVVTLPMSVVFATLMAFGGLSGHGEITALRAGGIGLYRMALPALGLGLTIAVGSFLLQGWLIPDCNNASDVVLAKLSKTGAGKQKNLIIPIPEADHPDRIVYAHDFDMVTQTLHKVLIVEIHKGQWGLAYSAESAQWRGNTWVLHGVQRIEYTADGSLQVAVPDLSYDIGKSPWELAQARRSLQDMGMDELTRLGQAPPGGDTQQAREAREELQMRVALPWAAIGLALVGLPLGIRPQRTSTGMGLGLSLGIILVYYIIIQLMRVLGQQGALPPALSDWIPNLLLYTIALGLLVNASR